MSWRDKLSQKLRPHQSGRNPTGTSWDRIPDSELGNPKFANTGTDWDGMSDEALRKYAETEEILRPAHESGTLAPDIILPNGRHVGGVHFYPYNGAGEAWAIRENDLKFRRLTDLATKVADYRQRNHLSLGLSDKHLTDWKTKRDSYLARWSAFSEFFQSQPLSVESVFALAAVSDAKLTQAFADSPLRDVVHVDVIDGKHPETHKMMIDLMITIDQRQVAEKLLELNPREREGALKKFYKDLSTLMVWGGNVRPRTTEAYVKEAIETRPECLKFCVLVGHHFDLPDDYYYRTPLDSTDTNIIRSVKSLNDLFSKKGVPPIELSHFLEETRVRHLHREEQKLLRQAGR